MAPPQMALIYCNECNGKFHWESELWEHMNTIHRRSVSEVGPFRRGNTQSDSIEDQLKVLVAHGGTFD
jgi:hypothetical protein